MKDTICVSEFLLGMEPYTVKRCELDSGHQEKHQHTLMLGRRLSWTDEEANP
jgi:hypothetical protein